MHVASCAAWSAALPCARAAVELPLSQHGRSMSSQGGSKRERQKKRKGAARARRGNDALMEHCRRRLCVGVQTVAGPSARSLGFTSPPLEMRMG